jgi:hypothetical protein
MTSSVGPSHEKYAVVTPLNPITSDKAFRYRNRRFVPSYTFHGRTAKASSTSVPPAMQDAVIAADRMRLCEGGRNVLGPGVVTVSAFSRCARLFSGDR